MSGSNTWSKYISATYIKEKAYPIEQLLTIVNDGCADGDKNNIADQLSEFQKNQIAHAFAVIAKELDVKIPEV